MLALYSRFGVKSITMDDICRELAISKKTLYQVVEDKNDLINNVLEYEKEMSNQMMNELSDAGENAIDELILVNRRLHLIHSTHNPALYFDLKKYYPDLFREWMDEKRLRMYEQIRRNLKRGKIEGLYRTELNEHIIARLSVARIEMMSSQEIINDKEAESGRFLQEIFLYHLHGICNENGLQYLSGQNDRFNMV